MEVRHKSLKVEISKDSMDDTGTTNYLMEDETSRDSKM